MIINLQHIAGAVIGGAVSGLFFYALGQYDGNATAVSNVCNVFEQLRPNHVTSERIATQDRPFADQVAAHNRSGARRGCW